ncbi:emp24p/erv25p- protein [Entophlyctis luteolus]|nr:emp24p/erv25p- protein [Entophlyctis luteolus]
MRGAVALRLLVVWLFAAASANALYFILDGVEQKCFVEELPKDTTVLGSKRILLLFALTPARHTGKYTASAWNQAEGKFIENKNQVVLISVETAINRHRLLNQKGSSQGKFTFTSTDSGEHLICL